MSTAKYDGDESGSTTRRCVRSPVGLFAVAVLLISGCDAVLGIESPIRGARDGGPQGGLSEAGRGSDGGIEAEAADSGSEDPPTAGPAEPECEDGALRCDDSTSGNRSKCQDGEWTDHKPCGAREQCDSQDDALCKELPVEGDRCDEPGSFKCPGVAKPERRRCDEDDLVWVDDDPCASGLACDRTDGTCLPIVPACAGRMPGDFVCDGSTRHTCGQDLTASVEVECASAAHCQQSTGPTCALCTEGEFRCVGRRLQACNAARDGWTLMEACDNEALCNAEAGDCTAATCTEGQYRCSGNRLEECNANRTGWDLVADCEDGLCDQAHGQCDLCSASHCDGNTRMICAPDRQTLESRPCEAPTGVCTGTAQCVECAAASDCTGGTICAPRTCGRNNHCEMSIGEPGTPCGGGFVCDMAGGCVDWSLDQLIPQTGQEDAIVTIRAKPGRFIHDPTLANGAQATGTSVELHENDRIVAVPPEEVLVRTPVDPTAPQQIRIRMPERADGWAATELVSVIVTYTPAADPSMGSIGALEFRYMP
jgi:hypothetical protein